MKLKSNADLLAKSGDRLHNPTVQQTKKQSSNTPKSKKSKDSAKGQHKAGVLFITSYPPRECGIATYSIDLINALNDKFRSSFNINICDKP